MYHLLNIDTEFTALVAHLPGGGLPMVDTTLHDAEHQLALHLAKVAQGAQIAAQKQAQQEGSANVGAGAIVGNKLNPHMQHNVHPKHPLVPPPVQDLPLPLPDYGSYIQEYPYNHPFPATTGANTAATAMDINKANTYTIPTAINTNTKPTSPVFSEDLDPGHRHFSGLHWVYPNTFLPYTPHPPPVVRPDYSHWPVDAVRPTSEMHGTLSQYVKPYYALKRAAYHTLLTKVERGGGHTGWSAVWEAALFARLHQPTHTLNALSKFVTRFVTSNLMCLHPPLEAKNEVHCGTCFGESPGLMFNRKNIKEKHTQETIMRLKEASKGVLKPVISAQELSVLQDVTPQPRGMVTEQPFSSKVL